MMSDPAFAISFGVVFSVMCAMIFAANVLRYKVINDRRNLWFVMSLAIMMLSILSGNLSYIASRYPFLDYNGLLSSGAYLPYTKMGVMLSVLVLIRAFTGKQYPYVWLYCSVAAIFVTLFSYVWLT